MDTEVREGVLTGQMAVRTRDVLRQIAFEHELEVISDKVASELRRQFWARSYLAVSSCDFTDEMIQGYIDEQEGEPVAHNSRFQIDSD